MLRSLLLRLGGQRPDPPDLTVDWPRKSPVAPDVDTTRAMIGPLKFGDSLTPARFFGRPDIFRWTQPAYCELVYAKAGFQIDYDSDRLAYAAFFIGPDTYLPLGASFSTPTLDSVICLSPRTSPSQVESTLGAPKSRDRDDKETVLFYERASLTLEFEWSATGQLKRLNVYPTLEA